MSKLSPKPSAVVAVVLSGRYPYEQALERLRDWTAQAAASQAEYICFPEYYFDQDRDEQGSVSR